MTHQSLPPSIDLGRAPNQLNRHLANALADAKACLLFMLNVTKKIAES